MGLNFSRLLSGFAILSTISLTAVNTVTAQEFNIVQKSCMGCHSPLQDGGMSRISGQRKTPEGWEMTITRMQLIHRLQISRQQQDVTSAEIKRELVKYLADNQGLAPSEAEPYRYLIEQKLNVIEDFEPHLVEMCGRCHSSARFALQRRTGDEWDKLVHYHLGQYPSSEYSMFGRDRDWFNVALNETVPKLTKQFPLQSDAWQEWQATPKPELAGRWRVIGEMPGKGKFAGVMQSNKTVKDNYDLTFSGDFENGEALSGSGSAIVYTGYEWRARLTLNDVVYRQALAANADGKMMRGRMYLKEHEEIGIQMELAREGEKSQLLSVIPGNIRAGTTNTITLHGTDLKGDISLGKGLKLVEVLARNNDSATLNVTADQQVRSGPVSIQVGDALLTDGITVYNRIDALQVTPAYCVARVGNPDEARQKLAASFTALGIDYGPDQTANTDDDINIGAVQATWSVEPFDEVAKHDRDVEFAGVMNAETGIFSPAGAGPNPQRRMNTNNAGNLKVIATLNQDGHRATGEGQLIVTVQRWNNPPLK